MLLSHIWLLWLPNGTVQIQTISIVADVLIESAVLDFVLGSKAFYNCQNCNTMHIISYMQNVNTPVACAVVMLLIKMACNLAILKSVREHTVNRF